MIVKNTTCNNIFKMLNLKCETSKSLSFSIFLAVEMIREFKRF
jgi:hypothetical protein